MEVEMKNIPGGYRRTVAYGADPVTGVGQASTIWESNVDLGRIVAPYWEVSSGHDGSPSKRFKTPEAARAYCGG